MNLTLGFEEDVTLYYVAAMLSKVWALRTF